MSVLPKLVVECSGSFRVQVLPGGRVEISMEDVNGDLTPDDTLYDKRGVANRLGTTMRSIDNFMKQRKNPLPYIKHAGRPRFRESDVKWWLDQGCSVAARRVASRLSGVISK
jgi:hypothetical protein